MGAPGNVRLPSSGWNDLWVHLKVAAFFSIHRLPPIGAIGGVVNSTRSKGLAFGVRRSNARPRVRGGAEDAVPSDWRETVGRDPLILPIRARRYDVTARSHFPLSLSFLSYHQYS